MLTAWFRQSRSRRRCFSSEVRSVYGPSNVMTPKQDTNAVQSHRRLGGFDLASGMITTNVSPDSIEDYGIKGFFM